jgi:hypothetical protein
MKPHILLNLSASVILTLFYSSAVYSAEPMSADAVMNLLSNNTTYCKNLQKNKEYTNYYRDDGTVIKLSPGGIKKLGRWRVSDNGRHCIDWGEEDGECCHPVIDQGNGTYRKLEEGEPKSEFRVTEGNPESL